MHTAMHIAPAPSPTAPTGQPVTRYHDVTDQPTGRPAVALPAAPRPEIDFDAAGGVDLDRLERSLELHGERVGQGRYHVTGGDSDHWVDLYTTSHPRCDCGDHVWRERICKHILAALLREGNDRVVASLGALLGRLRAARQAA